MVEEFKGVTRREFPKVAFNDLSRGWLADSAEVTEACSRVIRSGKYIQGPEHDLFEIELAMYLGVRVTLGVASGTDALQIALRAVGCEQGSKVITVANAGGYTSVVASEIGCEIIYCDVDPLSLVMTEATLEPLLSSDIHAVVVTHLYGNVAPVKRIRELCDPLGIYVIEDCAQVLGGKSGASHAGALGHIATFSFYPTKNLGGIGDGGAIATNDMKLAARVRSLREYGWGKKYSIDISGGKNSRLDEIQAAILRIGLTRIEVSNKLRRAVLEHYRLAFENCPIKMVNNKDENSTVHLAVVRVPKDIGRDYIRQELLRRGIQTAVHYPILDCDQAGLGKSRSSIELPESREATAEILSLPCFPEISQQESSAVAEEVLDIVSSLGYPH